MPRRLVLTHTFASDQAALDAYNQRHLGQREVPIAAIVGTVGRSGLRDTRRLKHLARTPRYRAIRAALGEGAIMPPVDLYLLAGNYYILDGHHRVAVARELGALEIDATVVEFLPRAEPAAAWHRDHAAFERDTGLTGLHLRHPRGYEQLRHQLAAHSRAIAVCTGDRQALRAVAADWARTVYHPVVAELARRRVPERADGQTVAELYLDFRDHPLGRGVLSGCERALGDAVAAYARLRRVPRAFRVVGRLAGGGRLLALRHSDDCSAH